MIRLGMLTTLTYFIVISILDVFPITFDASRWYAGLGLVGLIAVLGLAAWGAWTAAAGQPLFKDEAAG